MGIRQISILGVLIALLFFSGCALLGLAEIEGVAALEAGGLTEGVAGSSMAIAEGETVPLVVDAVRIQEFRTIIRSDLTMDGYTLLKKHLPAAEFEIIEGTLTSEGSVNSLLSKVRVARSGTLSPRLYINTAYHEGVEIAEVTSNRTIRLLRNGKSYSVPGEMYTTKSNAVYLKDINTYRILAHVNVNQLILVLDELPLNGMVKVRIGTHVGYIASAFLIALSTKKYHGGINHNYYSNYQTITCKKCNGAGHLFCFNCSGKGKIICPICNGNREHVCERCSGAGKETCNECGGVGAYSCSICDGSGKKDGQYCSNCVGRGKVFCQQCKGNGTFTCTLCLGKEMVACVKCSGLGNIQCNICQGNGIFSCSVCKGLGKNWIVVN
jgi:hypothetical protein